MSGHIDTRSDIYSPVLLYELLMADAFDSNELQNRASTRMRKDHP